MMYDTEPVPDEDDKAVAICDDFFVFTKTKERGVELIAPNSLGSRPPAARLPQIKSPAPRRAAGDPICGLPPATRANGFVEHGCDGFVRCAKTVVCRLAHTTNHDGDSDLFSSTLFFPGSKGGIFAPKNTSRRIRDIKFWKQTRSK